MENCYYLKRLKPGLFSTQVVIELWCDEKMIVGDANEEAMRSLFREFCNAKAADMIHDKIQIVVCSMSDGRTRYKMTKKFFVDPTDVEYSIWKKRWNTKLCEIFGCSGIYADGWEKLITFSHMAVADDKCPEALERYVLHGDILFGQDIMEKC